MQRELDTGPTFDTHTHAHTQFKSDAHIRTHIHIHTQHHLCCVKVKDNAAGELSLRNQYGWCDAKTFVQRLAGWFGDCSYCCPNITKFDCRLSVWHIRHIYEVVFETGMSVIRFDAATRKINKFPSKLNDWLIREMNEFSIGNHTRKLDVCAYISINCS